MLSKRGQLMAEKQILSLSRHRDLNRSVTNPRARAGYKHTNKDAMILPYDANPRRMEFSERTVPLAKPRGGCRAGVMTN
jgi:hypothetical protein